MNTATATYSQVSATRGIVTIKYVFTDGRENHEGFSTVEVLLPTSVYDGCYDRADALAKEHGCRLEKFSKDEYRVFLNNFQYYLDTTCDNLTQAKEAAKKAGFDATIYQNGEAIGSWSILGGYRMF